MKSSEPPGQGDAREEFDVLFEICYPTNHSEFFKVKCQHDDNLHDLLQKLAEKSIIDASKFEFMYQCEYSFFDHTNDYASRQIAIECFDKNANTEDRSNINNKSIRITRDGRKVDETDPRISRFECINVLIHDMDDVWNVKGYMSRIRVDLNVVFLDCAMTDGLELKEVENGLLALRDPRFVAWIECCRVRDAQHESDHTMFACSPTHGLIDTVTGRCFTNFVEAFLSSHIPMTRQRVEVVYILLQHSSQLPKLPIPELAEISVAIRGEVKLDFIDDRVVVEEETHSPASSRRWSYYRNGVEGEVIQKMIRYVAS